MSAWNYRIVRYYDRSAGYGLHEVHYNDAGKPVAMSAVGAQFYAGIEEGPSAVVDMLGRALADAQKHEILDQPAGWSR